MSVRNQEGVSQSKFLSPPVEESVQVESRHFPAVPCGYAGRQAVERLCDQITAVAIGAGVSLSERLSRSSITAAVAVD
jgi:hypothetical protein